MSSTSTATEKGGLVPGSKHVEQFGPDEDYEDDGAEEEFYVTLDLGSVDHTLVPSSSSYRLIGLDTENPFLQLSGTIMRGYHQSLIGTELVFKDVTEDEDEDEEKEGDTPRNTNTNTNSTNVRYSTKTNRRIVFREVELKKPKTVVSGAASSTSTSTGTGDAPRTSPHKDKESKKRHVDISSLCFGSPSGGEHTGETSNGGADPAVEDDAAVDATTTTTTTAG